MKLEDNKNRKLTRPDFPGKIRIIQKSRKRVFADFATLNGFLRKSEALSHTSYI